MSALAPLCVAVPLGVAAVIAGASGRFPRALVHGLAIGTGLFCTVVSSTLLLQSRAAPIVYWFGGWYPRSGVSVGICFAIDPIGAGLAVLSSILATCGLAFVVTGFDDAEGRLQALMLAFLAALCGFSFTGDLFNLFVFFELMSASAIALCGYKTRETQTLQGAIHFAVTNTIGAFLVLFGIALLYGRTGALNLAQIGRALDGHHDALVAVAFAVIVAGFAVKAAIVPFHFWLADAHAVAPTSVCILFSGVMVEAGLYGIARVYGSVFAPSFAMHHAALRTIGLTAGALTAIVGALMCFSQRHLKRLLAFSTISHMGTMSIGVACLKRGALGGVATYVAGHAGAKGALFLCAGMVLHRYRSVDEHALRGRGRDARWLGALFVLGACGLASVFPFATFFGEAAIDEALGELHPRLVQIAVRFSAILTAAAVFRVVGVVFLGAMPSADASSAGGESTEGAETKRQPITAWMVVPTIALIVLSLVAGLAPLRDGAVTHAQRVLDTGAAAALVLDGARSAISAKHLEVEPRAILFSVLQLAAAFGVALVALRIRLRERSALTKAIKALRAIHTGRVGDVVTWLALGAAALSALCLFALR